MPLAVEIIQKDVPRCLWGYGLVYQAEVMSVLSRGPDGRTGYEEVTGETPNISELVDFDFYNLVWYYDRKHPTVVEDDWHLGWWLGIANRIGSALCYWVLTSFSKVIAQTRVRHITRDYMSDPDIQEQVNSYNEQVTERLKDEGHVNGEQAQFYLQEEEDPDPAYGDQTPADAKYGDMLQEPRPKANNYDNDAFDKYISAEVNIDDEQGSTRRAKVKARACDFDGFLIGREHRNPMLETRLYELEFEDGTATWYHANVIAENLFSQVDSEGCTHLVFNEIIGYHTDDTAIKKDDGHVYSKSRNREPKKMTQGWHICIEWKDGTSDWIDLKEVKVGNPVELAEYVAAQGLLEEPAFKWWAAPTLRRRDRIISKVKSKYWRTNHNFGIRLPKTVEEALRIEMGTTFWQGSIRKELSNVKVAWEVCNDVTPKEARSGQKLIGYQQIRCHIIFDVKMNFRRKAQFVAGGHTTETLSSITYSSGFLIAALNDLDVMTCDVTNAYLHALGRERIWFIGGHECGEDAGKVMVVRRALYGLKSMGASWRAMFSTTLQDMGFSSTIVDPDVYLSGS